MIVIIPEKSKKEIPDRMSRYFQSMNIEYFAVPEQLGSDDSCRQLGTADSLRLIADKIKVSY